MNYATATPQTPLLPIRVGAVSEIGHREQNQDCMSAFSSAFGAVYLIADGMGGYRGGAEAAQLVAEAVNRHLLAAPASLPAQDAITLAVRLANVEVLERSKSGNPEFSGMGSTVVLAVVQQDAGGLKLTTAHIGDSRAYLYRDGCLTLLTKDHTQVQWLIDNNAIDEASARNHPDASVLTRALGHTTDLQVDISEPIPLQEGDGVLLCSDGLSGFAPAEDIAATIAQNPEPNGCASQLAQLALAAGSSDNITVQFLRIGAVTPDIAAKFPAEASKLPGPSRSQRPQHLLRLISIVAAIVLALGAGAAWWLHSRGSAKKHADPAVTEISTRVHKLKIDCNKLHNDAQNSQTTAKDELAKLEKLGGPAGKPASLSKDVKNLKDTLTGLETEFANIVGKSNQLIQDAKDYDSQVQELLRPPEQPPSAAKRQQMMASLKEQTPTSEKTLQEKQANLGSKQKDLETAKTREAQLISKWNEAGRARKPAASDEAAPAPAKDKTKQSDH